MGETIKLTAADGHDFEAYVAAGGYDSLKVEPRTILDEVEQLSRMVGEFSVGRAVRDDRRVGSGGKHHILELDHAGPFAREVRVGKADGDVVAAGRDLQRSDAVGDFEQLVKLRTLGEIEATDQHIVNAVDFLLRYYIGRSPNGQFFTDRIQTLGPAIQLYF